MIRIDREDRHELPDEILGTVIRQAERALEEVEACVISDYGKGVITARLLEVVLPAARARGIPVTVDPKETHFFRYLGVSTITPNQMEASAAFGRRIRDVDTLLQAGRALLERLDSESVLITRGAEGMALFRPHEPALGFPAVAHEVYDVTGAGDTVVSVFALALAAGAELSEAAAIANHAAGLVVQEVGTATPSLEGLVASIQRDPERWQPTPLSFALGER
jgi:D-beta-D-heptose 7-phosphate kinase/D-beta-D-heptose 1-phosphate adenosyltransferase